MDENSFLLNKENRLLEVSYLNDNYKVIHGLKKNKICVVFFSGNALYYPNNETCFKKMIFLEDRYEWAHVSSILLEYVEKIILIRDIRKSWYVDGINSSICTLEKTVKLVRDLTEGYRVIIYGNSAGGYMAMVTGMIIGADRVYNWGGQVNLKSASTIKTEFLKTALKEPQKEKYLDIRFMLQNNKVPIFSYYAAKNPSDIENLNILKKFPNVFLGLIDSENHGIGFQRDVYINMIHIDKEKLMQLMGTWEDKVLSPKEMGRCINDLTKVEERYEEPKESTILRMRHSLGNIKRRIIKKH